jgi:hydrogenase nickel incorporation protein HypA/HybF
MHEMSIAQSLLDIAIAEAVKHGSGRINKIKLRLGEFRGVVREALEFSFEALKRDTLAAEAELEVEAIKLRIECENCGEAECAANDYNFICPRCGAPLVILAGRELQIEYIELE